MIAGFFPGQGSQSVGMGRELYDEFTVFRQTIEEASDTLGVNLKTLLFEGPDSELMLTENAQPAILAVSTGCFRVAESVIGARTSVHLGHSLGEYSALVASEAFPFADAVSWVRTRGLAMQKAVPVGQGTMAAVIGAEDADIEVWCREATEAARALRASGAQEVQGELKCTVECANYNAPGQVVVSGSIDAVDQFEKSVSSKGIRGVMVKRLAVSAPFHSSLMAPARIRMKEEFDSAKDRGLPESLKTPYIPNRTAIRTSEPGVVFPLLEEQVDHSVLWSQSVSHLLDSGITRAIEFGPGKVLQGLAKRIAKSKNLAFETIPVFDLETLKAAEKGIHS
jgi:[acyl-carrier-protein] S-malonyltransferase